MAHCEITTKSPSKRVDGTKHKIYCTKCDKKLGIILESKQKSKILSGTTKYKCICSCGGESFSVVSENECYFIPEPNISIKSMPVEIKKNFIEYNIFVEDA